MLEELQLISR